MGENPIEKTIKLVEEDYSDSYLELRTDCTALRGNDNDEPWAKFNYAYDADAKKIYMRLEKYAYDDELLTYNENLSIIDEKYSLENRRERLRYGYEEDKDKNWFKEEYPDCNSYEDYEREYCEERGFDSLAAYSEYWKQAEKDSLKALFSAQITYSYNTENGKMTLTEKFTGVKNMLVSECEYYDSSSGTHCYIYSDWASIYEYNDGEWKYYYGIPDTDKKTIAFRSEDDGTQIKATYTEDINAETVTVKFNGNEYVCKFEGEKFIEE